MKILHIIDSLGLGGAQTVVKGIFESQKNNKDIYLYALRKREINIKIDHPNVFSFNSNSKYSFKPLKQLKEIMEKEKIDILHCHLPRSQVIGYLLKRNYFPKIKLIFHEHGDLYCNKLPVATFYKCTRNKVDLFIAVSNFIKRGMIKKAGIDPKKIIVLYNFVDLTKFNRKNIKWDIQKEKEKLGIKKDEIVIGFAGRLNKVKGCEYLIKSLPSLTIKYNVLIAGEGSLKKELENLAERLNVRDRVIFLGYTDKMVWFYSLIDVLIVPSLYESFGLSVIEAKSMRVPVVCSKVDGLIEVGLKNALYFEARNSSVISKIINQIKSSKKMRIKLIEGGYQNALRFSLKNYLRVLKEIYVK